MPRIVTGRIFRGNGDPWDEAEIKISLTRPTFTPSGTYPVDPIVVVTDAAGYFSQQLATDLPEPYMWTLPDKSYFFASVPAGDGAITIEALRSTVEQQ